MNQNNNREGIEERFWKMMKQNQFVKSTNSVTYQVEEYPPAIVDMEATVSIYGEFDKYAIDEWFHQELQKAREEERERIIYVTKNIKDAFMSPLTERRWLQCIQFTDQPKPKDQSELDQPDALTK